MILFLSSICVANIAIMQIVEIYVIFIKGNHGVSGTRQILAYANVVQYFARIMYILALFGLTVLLEVYGLSFEILLIVFIGFVVGLFGSLILCVWGSSILVLNFIFAPIIIFAFPSLQERLREPVKQKMNFGGGIPMNKISFATLIASTLIGLAAIVPFLVAIIASDYRMIATYFGQLLNFGATLLLFLIVDPILFRGLDEASPEELGLSKVGHDIIISKLASQVVLVLILAGLISLNNLA